MRKILIVIFFTTTIIVGCGRKAGGDCRIAVADSLLCVPDSDGNCENAERAEWILSGVDNDSLNERDRALYSLLMVNARIKNMRDIGEQDDSAITSAAGYFERHNERNYLARSYLYKGFVRVYLDTTSSGEPLDWYLRGLNMLNSGDSFWLGYAHFRIARYYASNAFVDSAKMISHMREALRNYEKAGDLLKVEVCASNLGSYYCTSLSDSCLYFAQKSLDMSQKIHDDYYYSLNNCTLAAYYCNKGNNSKGNEYARAAASVDEHYFTERQPYYYLACSYLGIGRLDSALIYAEKFGADGRLKAKALNIKYLIQKKEGNLDEALKTMEEIYRFRSSQLEGALQRNMMLAELRNEKQKVENAALATANEALKNRSIFIIVAFSFMMLATLGWAIMLRQRKHAWMLAKKNAILTDEMASHKEATSEMARRYDAVMEEIDFKGLSRLETKELGVRVTLMTAEQRRKLVVVIRNFINARYDGIIDTVKADKTLSERNIDLLALKAYGLSSKIIATLLDYKDAKTVYVILNRILKRLGVDSIRALTGKHSLTIPKKG